MDDQGVINPMNIVFNAQLQRKFNDYKRQYAESYMWKLGYMTELQRPNPIDFVGLFGEELGDLLERMLEPVPERRITIPEVINHRYFSSLTAPTWPAISCSTTINQQVYYPNDSPLKLKRKESSWDISYILLPVEELNSVQHATSVINI